MKYLGLHNLFLLLIISSLVACGSANSTKESDIDRDGFADSIDAFPNNDSEHIDSDGDGVGDNGDAFPDNPAETKDSDSDGLGDNTDAFPLNSDERIDTDGDEIGNNSDNCFLLFNPAQKDHNNDGIGDLCSLNDTGAVYTVLEDSLLTDSECIDSIETKLNQQDCSHGRDSLNINGELIKYGHGIHAMDYTKLDALGNELLSDAIEWDCVRDNVNGYIWEAKTNGNLSDIHHADHEYIFTAESTINDDACPFYDAVSNVYCTIESYITLTNKQKFCGRENWKLPKVIDVINISNFHQRQKQDPAFDFDFFYNTEDFITADQVQESYNGELASAEELKRLRFSTYINFEIDHTIESERIILTSPSEAL